MKHKAKHERLLLTVQIEGGGGGGGGGGGYYPTWYITPTSFGFGNIVVGKVGQINCTIKNIGTANMNVSVPTFTLTSGGAVWSSTFGTIAKTIPPGGSYSFVVKFSPNVNGACSGKINFTANDSLSPHSYGLTGTGISAGPVIVSPSSVNFPTTKIGVASTGQVVTLINTGAGSITVNSYSPLTDFSISGPVPPFGIAGNGQVNITVNWTPTSPGIKSGNITVNNTGPSNPTISVNGIAVLLLPVGVNFQNQRALVLACSGLASGPIIKSLGPLINYNSDLAGSLVFNGSMWKAPGSEKSIMRVEVFYENLGVFTLSFLLTVWRPQDGPDSFDVKTQSKTFGTALADGTVRSDYVDIEATGELMELSVVRGASAGNVSLIAVVPQFIDRGEKVAGV